MTIIGIAATLVEFLKSSLMQTLAISKTSVNLLRFWKTRPLINFILLYSVGEDKSRSEEKARELGNQREEGNASTRN